MVKNATQWDIFYIYINEIFLLISALSIFIVPFIDALVRPVTVRFLPKNLLRNMKFVTHPLKMIPGPNSFAYAQNVNVQKSQVGLLIGGHACCICGKNMSWMLDYYPAQYVRIIKPRGSLN